MNLCDAVSWKPISVDILPTLLMSLKVRTFQHLDAESDMGVKTVLCVNVLSSYNTTLNITRLFYERRHDVVSWTSINCKKWQKKWQAPFLLTLMLLANANVPAVAVCNFADQWMIL